MKIKLLKKIRKKFNVKYSGTCFTIISKDHMRFYEIDDECHLHYTTWLCFLWYTCGYFLSYNTVNKFDKERAKRKNRLKFTQNKPSDKSGSGYGFTPKK